MGLLQLKVNSELERVYINYKIENISKYKESFDKKISKCNSILKYQKLDAKSQGSVNLQYSVLLYKDLISIDKLLSTEYLSQVDFIEVLYQMFLSLLDIRIHRVHMGMLVFDLDYIFYDRKENKVYFLAFPDSEVVVNKRLYNILFDYLSKYESKDEYTPQFYAMKADLIAQLEGSAKENYFLSLLQAVLFCKNELMGNTYHEIQSKNDTEQILKEFYIKFFTKEEVDIVDDVEDMSNLYEEEQQEKVVSSSDDQKEIKQTIQREVIKEQPTLVEQHKKQEQEIENIGVMELNDSTAVLGVFGELIEEKYSISLIDMETNRIATLQEGVYVIGRGKTFDEIEITSKKVSREHFELKIEKDKVFIKDLGSVNGLILNGKKETTQVQWYEGIILEVGDMKFIYEVL